MENKIKAEYHENMSIYYKEIDKGEIDKIILQKMHKSLGEKFAKSVVLELQKKNMQKDIITVFDIVKNLYIGSRDISYWAFGFMRGIATKADIDVHVSDYAIQNMELKELRKMILDCDFGVNYRWSFNLIHPNPKLERLSFRYKYNTFYKFVEGFKSESVKCKDKEEALDHIRSYLKEERFDKDTHIITVEVSSCDECKLYKGNDLKQCT